MAPPKKVNGLRGDRRYVTSAARDDAGVNRPRSAAYVADAPCLRRECGITMVGGWVQATIMAALGNEP